MGTPATYQLTVGMILNLIPPRPPIMVSSFKYSIPLQLNDGSEKTQQAAIPPPPVVKITIPEPPIMTRKTAQQHIICIPVCIPNFSIIFLLFINNNLLSLFN